MSGYAEEFHPCSNIDSVQWSHPTYAEFEYSTKDHKLADKLLVGNLKGEELEAAVHRLAQVASVTGSVMARTSLALFGGISIDNTALFVPAVNSDVVSIPMNVEHSILRLAREARDSGDIEAYIALNAVVGCYPPEYGDGLPCIDSPTANPHYDSQAHFMNDTAYFDQIGAVGNGG